MKPSVSAPGPTGPGPDTNSGPRRTASHPAPDNEEATTTVPAQAHRPAGPQGTHRSAGPPYEGRGLTASVATVRGQGTHLSGVRPWRARDSPPRPAPRTLLTDLRDDPARRLPYGLHLGQEVPIVRM